VADLTVPDVRLRARRLRQNLAPRTSHCHLTTNYRLVTSTMSGPTGAAAHRRRPATVDISVDPGPTSQPHCGDQRHARLAAGNPAITQSTLVGGTHGLRATGTISLGAAVTGMGPLQPRPHT
jgi:hypothetical protein